MKIDLFDVKEFVEINKLQEITSPILFQRGGIPHPEGLISNEIFGVTTKSRRETFAYIDLHGHFFHPHIYKVLKRIFRNIEKIVNGESYYIIDKDGRLIPDDENGETGIEFLYDNWEKLNWSRKDNKTIGSAVERSLILSNFRKNEIFMEYQIVIPAFYRDIRTEADSNGGETEDINNMYSKLIRLCSLLNNQNMFDFQFHSTNYNIQNIIVDIYNYFKQKLEKKNGLIRKYLMGKNVDYCTRTVITNPTYHANRPEDLFTDFNHVAIPISQVCSLAYPFVLRYIKTFFENYVIDAKNSAILYDPVNDEIATLEIDDPESYFTDKFIKKMMDTFIKDPESRFNKIEVPVKNSNKKFYLALSGMRMDSSNTSELSATVNRPMTWTDLLYIAAVDVCKDKHVLITRYPVTDEFGLFVAKIRVSSTIETMPLQFNGQLYKFYPVIDPDLPIHKIGSHFIDSVQFSNSYLEGMGGDYDGDQTTVKIIFTLEANEECERVINNKSFFINSAGSNIRVISKEAIQTFFAITKDPDDKCRALTKEEKDFFINLDPKTITFDNIVDWFACLKSTSNKSGEGQKPKYNPGDYFTISHKEYKLIDSDKPVQTTLGRLIFNKLLIESLGLENIVDYQNTVVNKKVFGKFDSTISNALKEDRITTEQMKKYIDMRDWFGLQVHAIVTSSFTPAVCKTPPAVVKLKKELLEKHKDDIAKGDSRVIEDIEHQLIDATLKELKGDVGLDLYISGARGSLDNHLKNILLSRGAIKNPVTNEYEIITNSLLDGLRKEDIATHTNVILSGAYPKACGTAVSGYMAKELLAALQTEVLADEGTDCGTKKYITVTITPNNIKDFMYRYVLTTNGLISIEEENKEKFIGKTVKMRTPMFCIGVGKTKCICNKCAGNFYYKMNKRNIGLNASRVATTMTNANMKKFHENVVRSQVLDVDDLII